MRQQQKFIAAVIGDKLAARQAAFGGGISDWAAFMIALGRSKDESARDPLLAKLRSVKRPLSMVGFRPYCIAAAELGDPALAPEEFEVVSAIGGWTPELGDWRTRKGEAFSGTDTYRTTFRHAGGKTILDLGTVCWYCRVKLNGEDLPAKGFPPYAWDVELKSGENVLEVTVANTGANETAAKAKKTSYDRYLRKFNLLNHESGLFGPVTLKRRIK